MNKTKQVIFWCLYIVLVMEIAFSVYYFQTTYDSPFAVVKAWHDVKGWIIHSGGIRQEKMAPMYTHDFRYGFSHKRNRRRVDDCWDYKTTYTIDSNRERFIPKPKDAAGQIFFIGSSYTFGKCVSDSETYSHILATGYWRNWEVHNSAVIAWGTSQAYIKLSDIINSDASPSMIIYGMTPQVIKRNYLRKEWILGIPVNLRKIPHFEVVNGNLEFQGLAEMSDGLKRGPKLRKKEIELTIAFLSAMQKKCAEKNISFIIVLLPSKHNNNYPRRVIDTLHRSNIPFLDLRQLEYEGLKSDKGQHPSPMDHRRIATAIAKSFISDILINISAPN